jgi:outer membrane immunogenic protein
MQKLLLGTVLLAIAGPAYAADMHLKAPIAPAPVFNWTGYYIGVNGGYAKDNASTDINPDPTAVRFINLLPETLDPAPKGYFGGGQVGANWQYGSVVAGLEADLQSGIKGTIVQSPLVQNNGTPFNGTAAVTQQVEWWGTARLRLGTTFVDPRFLIFATAGVAYARIDNTANTDFRPQGTIQYPTSVGDFRTGLVAGGGAEFAFTNNLSLKAEYLYLDLGTNSTTAQPVPANPPFTITYNFHTTMQVVRGGLNWKFSGM